MGHLAPNISDKSAPMRRATCRYFGRNSEEVSSGALDQWHVHDTSLSIRLVIFSLVFNIDSVLVFL